MKTTKWIWIGMALLAVLGCRLLAPPTPSSDLLATLQASTPLSSMDMTQQAYFGTPLPPALQTSTPPASFPTPIPGNSSGGPAGKIVWTCQLYKVQAMNQICLMNADGSGFRRLTTDNDRQHVYASFSPDGSSVVYVAFREANVYEIYEMSLADGSVKQLTDRLGVLNAPEISPDGTQILFHNWVPATERDEIWVMDRNGKNPRRMFNMVGWDPTWSPDGKQVLFATNRDGTNQLWAVNTDGSGLRQVSDLPALRGRSDWSSQNQVVTYSGEAWARELYLMNADGSDQHRISPDGGNSQGPSFSPDGQWVTFTAYFDNFNDIHGCEIYIMRIDGTDLRRLTNNDYCDYQPRWGP